MELSPALQKALSNPRGARLAIDRERCEESLMHYLRGAWKYITPHRYVDGWHMDAIAAHLEAVTYGHINRLIINEPPRMTKSSLVSVAWPTWTWALRASTVLSGPTVQFLSASYGAALATRDSVKSRRLIQSPWYQERWGNRFELTGDQNAKQRYDNSVGGYRLATSVGGALTGEGGDIILIDDPHNTIEIDSEAKRAEAVQWWDEAMSTRLNDLQTGAYVIIMQRLFENDLTGHALSQSLPGEWTHLMLPMEYDSSRHCTTPVNWLSPVTELEEPFSDPRTYDGELLCPERVGESALLILKSKLGPFGVAGQLQQEPTVRGGAILQEDWWNAWPPHVEQVEDRDPNRKITYPTVEFILASLDTAMTEKEENDPSAMTVWGLWHDKFGMPQVMLMEAWEERLGLHTLVTKTIGVCSRRKVDRLLIEAKNNGFSVAQEVARLTRGNDWGVFLEPVKGDKVARAHACVPTFASGQVWAPAKNVGGNVVFLNWAQKVISNCSMFPRGEHDDLTDSTTQAINHLRKNGMLQSIEERKDEMRRAGQPPGRPKAPLYGMVR